MFVPVESSRNSLLHGSLPVVATIGSHIDCPFVSNHLRALLPRSLYVNLPNCICYDYTSCQGFMSDVCVESGNR
jgi:hypothetical protein